MVLVVRVHEVLDLGHRELSHSQKALLRVDLVTETQTDLGSRERHFTVVIVKKSSKVDEDTLSGLWAEETSLCTSGTNLSLEHEVERNSLRQIIASLG